jgi:uncharacterized membrane protein
MSLLEVLILMACGGGLLMTLTLGAWVLINKSKLENPQDRSEQLEALDREYASGDLDEDEYERRRARIMNERLR